MKKSFDDLNNFLKENNSEIEKYIYEKYSIRKNRFKLISKETEKSLKKAAAIAMQKKEEFPIFGFFDVLGIYNKKLVLFKYENENFFRFVNLNGKIPEPNQTIFGILYRENGEYLLDEDFVVLDGEETETVRNIFIEYTVDDEILVFVDVSVDKRIIKSYKEYATEIQDIYYEYIAKNYSILDAQKTMDRFFKAAEFSYDQEDYRTIYDLDYYEFLENECSFGNFLVENDLENFIEIAEFILKDRFKAGTVTKRSVDSIEKSRSNIFILKNLIVNYGFQTTDKNLVDSFDNYFSNTIYRPMEIEKTGEILFAIFSEDDLEVTEVKRNLSTKSVRKIQDSMQASVFDLSRKLKRDKYPILNFIEQFIFQNKLCVTVENKIEPTNRLRYLFNDSVGAFYANILTNIWSEKFIKDYLKVDENAAKKLMEEVIKNKTEKIETEENSVRYKFFEMLSFVSMYERDEKKYCEFYLTDIGRIFINNLSKKNLKGKIINLEDYK